MSHSRGFDIRSAIGATALVQVATIAAQLMIISALPRFWGSHGLGAWNTWLAAVGLLGALELGVGAFIGNRVVYLGAASRAREAASLLLTCNFFVIAAQSAAAGIALVVVWFGPWPIAHEVFAIGSEEASILIVLASLLGMTGICTGSSSALLATAGRYAFSNYVIALSRLLEAVALIGMAALQLGLVAVAAGQLCIRASVLLWMAHVSRRHVAWASKTVTLSKHAIRETINIVAAGGVVTLSAAAARDGLVLALAAWQGPHAVALFTSLRTLCNGALQCFHVVSQPITTALAYRAGLQEHGVVQTIFRRLLAVAFAGGTVAAFAIALGSDFVLRSLTANALRVDWGNAVVMALYCLLSILFAALSSILVSLLRLKALGVAYACGAMTALGTLFVLRDGSLAPSIGATAATFVSTIVALSPALKASTSSAPIASSSAPRDERT